MHGTCVTLSLEPNAYHYWNCITAYPPIWKHIKHNAMRRGSFVAKGVIDAFDWHVLIWYIASINSWCMMYLILNVILEAGVNFCLSIKSICFRKPNELSPPSFGIWMNAVLFLERWYWWSFSQTIGNELRHYPSERGMPQFYNDIHTTVEGCIIKHPNSICSTCGFPQ